jgi:hypothetical protein
MTIALALVYQSSTRSPQLSSRALSCSLGGLGSPKVCHPPTLRVASLSQRCSCMVVHSGAADGRVLRPALQATEQPQIALFIVPPRQPQVLFRLGAKQLGQ